MRVQTIIPRKGINDDNLGKKHALHQLILASEAEYVWLQDDDVDAPSLSEEQLIEAIGNADMLIMPLRMRSDSERPSCIERLQMAEYAAIWQLTIETALRGRPILCSGANLLVRRQAWLDSWCELHPEIPSGDDMFLLESMKRHHRRIRIVTEDKYASVVHPLTSTRALLHQRMRWAGKAPHYRDADILRWGGWIVFLNCLQAICPPVLLLKFPFEYALILRREPKTSLGIALLLEWVYPYYMLLSLLGGVFSKRAW